MPFTKTLDPGKHFLNFAGIPIKGYASGTYIKISRDAKTWKKKVGAGGDVARLRMRDRSGTVTVTLMATDPTNDLLSGIGILDEETGAGIGVLSFRDGGGTSKSLSTEAWLEVLSDAEYTDSDVPTREWTFHCAKLEHFVGGNS